MRELNELKDRAEKFAHKIANHGGDRLTRKKLALLLRSLHGPTIAALEDSPVLSRDDSVDPALAAMLEAMPDVARPWRLRAQIRHLRIRTRATRPKAHRALGWTNTREPPPTSARRGERLRSLSNEPTKILLQQVDALTIEVEGQPDKILAGTRLSDLLTRTRQRLGRNKWLAVVVPPSEDIGGAKQFPLFSDILRHLPDRLDRGLSVSERDMRLVAATAEHAMKKEKGRQYPNVGSSRSGGSYSRRLARHRLSGRDRAQAGLHCPNGLSGIFSEWSTAQPPNENLRPQSRKGSIRRRRVGLVRRKNI
jgi:hypothetical protein